jgi:hydroxyacylglutathione hydrolase
MKLAEDIYAYEWTSPFENNCNSFYIGGDVGALIDPGLTMFLPELLTKMEKDGIKRSDIKYVINTHSHPDHFEGSEEFNGDDGVQVALHEKEKEFYDDVGGDMYRLFGRNEPNVTIDLVLKEGPLEMGGESFEVYLVPGHSPGSIALYWPARKALFPGDVIFVQNVGRSDFPGGDSKLLKESILKLSKLDVDYFMPGHIGILAGNAGVKDNFRFVIERVFPYL